MRFYRNKFKGVTLLEVLVALSLFAIVSLISITASIEITQLQYFQRINQHVQEEARYTIEYINRELQHAKRIYIIGSIIIIQNYDTSKTYIAKNATSVIVSKGPGDSHLLIGDEVKVNVFKPTQINGQSFNITLTIEPAERTNLRTKKSIYLGPEKIEKLISPYTIETTLAIP